MINKILPVSSIKYSPKKAVLPEKQVSFQGSSNISFAKIPLGNIYGANIHFGNAQTDYRTPLQRLTDNNEVRYDQWTMDHVWHGSSGYYDKRWVFAEPYEALDRPIRDAINSNLTLSYLGDTQKAQYEISKGIPTPDFGDNWGRYANYIEINNRALSNMWCDRSNSSMLNMIKLLPLIPPSHDKYANCILISQLFPNIYGDGWNNNGENSLYGMKLENERLSDNIGYLKVGDEYFTPEDQVRAFNDIAHLRGFKTAFRMLISEDQIRIGDSAIFRWNNPEHVEAYIIACCKAIELGFDGIFFDGAKHVGGYDMGNYAGVGAVPSYEQMQYILYEIRNRTKRHDLSFIGEHCCGDKNVGRYQNMGLSAGTYGVNDQDVNDVRKTGEKLKGSGNFAFGPVVTCDNDGDNNTPPKPYEQKIKAIESALFGYNNPQSKLPAFMQMNDLFPLNWGTTTHQLMLENRSFSSDGSPVMHFYNLFTRDENEDARNYREKVNRLFADSYCYGNQ